MPSRSPALKTLLRAALALAGIGLAATSVLQLRSFRTEQRQLAELVRETGALAHDPRLLDALSREPDPWRARLRLARTLLASATDGSQADPAVTLRRLEVARELSSEAGLERPASWEAAMIQGAATYLGWSLRRDRQLLSHPEEWEGPLLRSLELAPGRPEPARFLAAAYLELWPALSRGKKESARRLLAGALADRPTFETLIEPWLRTAGGYQEAFAAMPPAPWAWERLQQIEARDADWEAYGAARRRWYAALETQMRRDLAEAEARLRGGDDGRARLLFLGLLQSPPRQRFVPLVQASLAQCPPGAGTSSVAPAIRSWLDWSLDLCLWRSCPLPEPMLRRLAVLGPELDAPAAARAALASGDLAAGEVYERRAESTWTESWGAYLVARAEALTRRRELADAEHALNTVHPAWTRSAPYWQARLALARSAKDGNREAEAVRRLSELRRSEWSYRDWKLRDPAPRLEIVPEGRAAGLTIEILGAPDLGAGVEVRLDGEVVAIRGAARGDVLTVAHPLDAGAHLLEVEAVSGGRLVPGTVRLVVDPTPPLPGPLPRAGGEGDPPDPS